MHLITHGIRKSLKAKELINALHHGDHINDMIKKWLSFTLNLLRSPVFYTLTKTRKPPNTVGRPIILGCEGPTERISSFVDPQLQPIAKTQKSYLKDTRDLLNSIEKMKVSN